MTQRLIRIAIACVIALPVAALIAWLTVPPRTLATVAVGGSGQGSGQSVPGVRIGGPFDLVAHTGERMRDTDFGDRHLLVYFGFTYCPDICPAELWTMSAAIDQLGEAGEAVQPLFITIDPERDTVDLLKDYVPLFHERMVGLTGTPDEIREVAQAYRVYYARAESDSASTYLMDHSAFVYLMGPDGSLKDIYRQGMAPEAMAEQIAEHLEPSPAG